MPFILIKGASADIWCNENILSILYWIEGSNFWRSFLCCGNRSPTSIAELYVLHSTHGWKINLMPNNILALYFM